MHHFYLSVVVPAYNAEITLEKCLKSIIQAPPIQKEIIVVDDGSTDQTSKIASELSVKLLSLNSNRGAATAKNIGLIEASGAMIAFIDSDCIIDECYFGELLSGFDPNDNTIGGVGGIIHSHNTNFITESFNVRFFGCSPSNETKKREIECLSGASSLYRKDLLIKVGGFDTNIRCGEDLDLNIRLKKAGYKLLLIPSAKSFHSHPVSYRSLVKKWFSYGKALAKVSIKNGRKREILFSWAWCLSCFLLTMVVFFTWLSFAWPILVLVFLFPWGIYYCKHTINFWSHNRKLKYLGLPLIHQVIIVSRSLGVIVGTVDYVLQTKIKDDNRHLSLEKRCA